MSKQRGPGDDGPDAHVGPRFDPPTPPQPKDHPPLGGFVAPPPPERVAPAAPPAATQAETAPILGSLSPDRHQRWRPKRWMYLLVGAVAACGLVWAASLLSGSPSKEDRYLRELRSIDLDGEFASDQAAVTNAEKVCRRLEGGARPEGYERDYVGVKYYCPDELDGFVVVKTPEYQARILMARLQSEELDTEVPTQEEAVARAKALCASLRSGTVKGDAIDRILVDVYCPQLARSFAVFETTVALGTFTLQAPLGPHAPLIEASGSRCEGIGLFDAYEEGTKAEVRNADGELLAASYLGQGSGSSTTCVFAFGVEVTEGEDAYVFTVNRRDPVTYTFDEIKQGKVDLQIGG